MRGSKGASMGALSGARAVIRTVRGRGSSQHGAGDSNGRRGHTIPCINRKTVSTYSQV